MIFLPLGLFALLFTFVNCVIVDDTSDLLVYSNSPAWETASESQPATVIKWAGNSRGSAYGGTWHESLTYMSTMKFTFTGTSISCYGIVAKVWDSTSIGFSIDGGTETRFIRDVTDFSHQESTAEDFDYGVQLFTATGLSPTSHTLVLTGYLKSALFGFDYLEYTAVDAASTTSQTTSNTQTTRATTSTVTNSTSMSTPTNQLPPISMSTASTSTAGDQPSIPAVDQSTGILTSQRANTAALAGGVIGGAAVLALLIFGVYWCLRKSRRTDLSNAKPIGTESVQPFSRSDQPYATPLSEKQRMAAAILVSPSSEQADHTVYQTHAKPPLSGWAHSPSYETSGESENNTISHYNTVLTSQGQQDSPARSTAPPSFRTRPLTVQYQYGRGVDVPSSESGRTSDILLHDLTESSARSPEEGDDSHTSGAERVDSAPPYFEDVLARTDARNLSENDVDNIARRLAEVMRINTTSRGGPGLLRGAPPRELIDQLVEDYLDER